MEKKELMEDFKALLEEKMPEHNFSQEAVANIGRVIGDAIKSKSEQYEQELSDLANQKKSLDEAEARMKKDIEELKTQLENSEASVESLKNEILETKKDSAFNSRMEEIEANYDLSDSDRELLAKEVGSLDIEDSSFDEYKEKISVMWAHKNKEYIEAKEKEFQTRLEEEVKKRISGESEASSEESENEVNVEEALASAKEEEVIPNNNTESSEEPQSLREKFSTAFAKENLTITF
jgi:prefoldin subunit 5